MNTPLSTAVHVDTMEELRDRVRAFVRERKVVSIEEQQWVRLMDKALDEATMLDFTFRLMNCAHKENGVFGERYVQLFREAEAFRAGMLAREKTA